MKTALVKTQTDNGKYVTRIVRMDNYMTNYEFERDLRGNGYKVIKVWDGYRTEQEVEEWHNLHRKR